MGRTDRRDRIRGEECETEKASKEDNERRLLQRKKGGRIGDDGKVKGMETMTKVRMRERNW